MNILRVWLRLLLGTKQQNVGREAGVEKQTSCFEAWICAYRQRLDNDRGRRPVN